jgi:hypothetical protein
MALMIEPNFEYIYFLILLIYWDKKFSQNSMSPPTLGLKFIKSSLRNLPHQGLSSNTKNLPPISLEKLILILLIS